MVCWESEKYGGMTFLKTSKIILNQFYYRLIIQIEILQFRMLHVTGITVFTVISDVVIGFSIIRISEC